MRPARGFTLVEMLVVVVIVAVLASTVVLGFVGADREQNLRTEAERLTALIELARSESLQRNEEWGVRVATDGYASKVFSPDLLQWEDVEERPFQPRTLELARLAIKIDAIELPDAGESRMPYRDPFER
jgi:general secretion pathway protein H